MSPPSDPKIHTRPPWANRLDRLTLIGMAILRRLIPPPNETLLARFARRGRPTPTPSEFDPQEFGLEDHLKRGREALETGALGEALHHFGQRIQQVSGDNWAWHGRGDALQLMGEYQGAHDAYATAIGLADSVGIHHAGLANALLGLEQPHAADQSWQRALELDPSLTWMR